MNVTGATIRIGTFGVPVIQAGTREEALRAWGYAHARDRAFQMDFARRCAAGRLAEWFGRSTLPFDRFQRMLGLTTVAGQILSRLPAAQRQLLTAYTEGVNRRLSRRRVPSLAHLSLLARMEPWCETDSLLVLLWLYQSVAFDLPSRQSEFVLKARLPPSIAAFLMSDVDPAFASPARDACPLDDIHRFLADHAHGAVQATDITDQSLPGSNCWTLDGQHTRSGRPILACDLHLPPTVPNHWHRIDMSVGAVRVTGVAIPGLPIVVAGSNGSLAWGVTNVPGDTLDLIAADECPGDRTVRRERIRVRRAADDELHIHESASGPVMLRQLAGRPVVLVWSGMWPTATDIGLSELAWCTNLEDAVDIARHAGGMPLNLHAAHVTGGTVQTVTGRVPQRVNGRLEPHRFVPPVEIAVLRSHPTGVLLTANQRRRDHARELPGGWNHSPGFRARRLAALLGSRSDWTEASIFHVQRDLRSEMLDFYRDLAMDATNLAPNAGVEALRRDVRTAIARWDGNVAAASSGAPLLMRFRQNLRSALLTPFLAACAEAEPRFEFSWRSTEYVVRSLVATRDARLLPGPPESDWWARVAGILFASAEQLQERHGRSVADLRWRDVAVRSLSSPLSRGVYRYVAPTLPLPADGDDDSVYVNTPRLTVSMRLVVSPGCEGAGVLVMPGGQSESPMSVHYRDQHRVWCLQVPSPLRDDRVRPRARESGAAERNRRPDRASSALRHDEELDQQLDTSKRPRRSQP